MILLSLLMSWALAAPGSPNFCVQTFNVYGPIYAPNTDTRTELLVQDLKQNGLCDFFFAQEMWNNTQYMQFSHLMGIDFGDSVKILRADEVRGDGLKSGLVSVSQSPIENPLSFLYAINKAGIADDLREQLGVKKGFLIFESDVQGQKLHLLNTHLHQSSVPVRLAQLIELHQALMTSNGYNQPWIFTGDLNFRPDSLEWRFLTRIMGFRDSFDEVATDKNACTYCSENMIAWDSDSRRIDFVLYRSVEQFKFKPVQAKIVLKGDIEFPLSDHYGIQTDFKYGEETPAPQFSKEEKSKVLSDAIDALEMDGRSALQPYIQYLKSELTK